ncbi:hypothetical protein F5J12DRAFT_897356 [Pisolithus orientalis]|uniref:uncharacterized protein n=1 Tax=Pisolithus orientalis TaxID=936130 RepID=UPI002225AC23|nr:uncharacterized protein F5J12DRAFT_897356 [Pisolithus orientalis]KAI5991989.1 hypothetical protein F5J12DRAFT_897356 [Pisolithus orientalis]
MVNFAELKAKAEKAKDAGVAKVVNTKDRYSSISSSKTTWDPNWKRGTPRSSTSSPPPPPPPRPTGAQGRGVVNTDELPPSPSRSSRPGTTISPGDVTPNPSPVHLNSPPPKRSSSGYPPNHKRTNSYADNTMDRIDWTNLSADDKEEFFRWLDEFFSRYLNVELGPRTSRVPSSPSLTETSVRPSAARSGPPPVNTATRPHAF